MLEVKNLLVFFENSLALNDLSLEVRKGEIVGVNFSSSLIGFFSVAKAVLGKIQTDLSSAFRITVNQEDHK